MQTQHFNSRYFCLNRWLDLLTAACFVFAQKERGTGVGSWAPGDLDQIEAAPGSCISQCLHTWRCRPYGTPASVLHCNQGHAHKDFFSLCSNLLHKKTNRVGQGKRMRKFFPGLLSLWALSSQTREATASILRPLQFSEKTAKPRALCRTCAALSWQTSAHRQALFTQEISIPQLQWHLHSSANQYDLGESCRREQDLATTNY